MVEWELYGTNSGRIDLFATLDENRIRAVGNPTSPQLVFSFDWHDFENSSQRNAYGRLMAVSLELYSPENSFWPLVQTGLIPHSAYVQKPLCLPLSQALIEDLSRRAEKHPDGELSLPISITVMARTSLPAPSNQTTTTPQTTNDVELYGKNNDARAVCITALQWSKFLEAWGYPAVRFIAVPTKLPGKLQTDNNTAAQRWAVALEALTTAQEKWRRADIDGAGKEMRRALLFAVLTWDALWHPTDPSEHEDVSKVVIRLGEHSETFRKKPFYIPDNASADAKRILGWLLLLRDLNTLANPFHHRGKKAIYSREDTDTLVTSVTVALGGLVKLWEEYPSPEALSR